MPDEREGSQPPPEKEETPELAEPEDRPPDAAPTEVVRREDIVVSGSLARCPYCHSDVVPEANDWVACRSCLARHHTACWWEGGKACATCGKRRHIAPRRSAARVREELRGLRPEGFWQGNLGRTVLGVGIVTSPCSMCYVFTVAHDYPWFGIPLFILVALGIVALFVQRNRVARETALMYEERRKRGGGRRAPNETPEGS